jgi:hypothetical protein
MLGTDYIETGESANFQYLSVDTITSRISNSKQSFHEQRPKVIGLQASLPPIDLLDLSTLADVKNQIAFTLDNPIEHTSTTSLLQTSLNDRGLHFRELFDEDFMIRYNGAFNGMEYNAINHVFNHCPRVLEIDPYVPSTIDGMLSAPTDGHLSTNYNVKKVILNMKANDNIFLGKNTFKKIPFVDNSNLFAVLPGDLVTSFHLDDEIDYLKKNIITFDSLITFKVLPEILVSTDLTATKNNQLISKQHLDTEIQVLDKTRTATYTSQITFNVLPLLQNVSSYAVAANQLVTKEHVDREFRLFLNKASIFTQELTVQGLYLKSIPELDTASLFSTLDTQLISKAHLNRDLDDYRLRAISFPNLISFGTRPAISNMDILNPTFDNELATKFYVDGVQKKIYGNQKPIIKSGSITPIINGEYNYNFPVPFPFSHGTNTIHVVATIINNALMANPLTLYITAINAGYFRYQIRSYSNGTFSNVENQTSICFTATQYSL